MEDMREWQDVEYREMLPIVELLYEYKQEKKEIRRALEEDAARKKSEERRRGMNPSDKSFSMFVVYDHPSDCPNYFIARCWEVDGKRTLPTDIAITADTLENLRSRLRRRGFTTRIQRSDGDDPAIVESYI